MADDSFPPVEPLSSPWRERLLDALAHVHHDLLLVGPYIKDDVVNLVKHALAVRLDQQPLRSCFNGSGLPAPLNGSR